MESVIDLIFRDIYTPPNLIGLEGMASYTELIHRVIHRVNKG